MDFQAQAWQRASQIHLSLSVPREFAHEQMRVQLYDLKGRQVRTVEFAAKERGRMHIVVECRGNPPAKGQYLCRLQAPGFDKTVLLHM